MLKQTFNSKMNTSNEIDAINKHLRIQFLNRKKEKKTQHKRILNMNEKQNMKDYNNALCNFF